MDSNAFKRVLATWKATETTNINPLLEQHDLARDSHATEKQTCDDSGSTIISENTEELTVEGDAYQTWLQDFAYSGRVSKDSIDILSEGNIWNTWLYNRNESDESMQGGDDTVSASNPFYSSSESRFPNPPQSINQRANELSFFDLSPELRHQIYTHASTILHHPSTRTIATTACTCHLCRRNILPIMKDSTAASSRCPYQKWQLTQAQITLTTLSTISHQFASEARPAFYAH